MTPLMFIAGKGKRNSIVKGRKVIAGSEFFLLQPPEEGTIGKRGRTRAPLVMWGASQGRFKRLGSKWVSRLVRDVGQSIPDVEFPSEEHTRDIFVGHSGLNLVKRLPQGLVNTPPTNDLLRTGSSVGHGHPRNASGSACPPPCCSPLTLLPYPPLFSSYPPMSILNLHCLPIIFRSSSSSQPAAHGSLTPLLTTPLASCLSLA
ncbi:hypothetical protein E2C01_013426 [Portunus trituberculatus]|uniref:Uncharacterized protein n=1 Tax=Portunus trituberculatus TaxID=210409 RepID=A0A5B7DG80_PORTR|nr:hypothetical protein [Portunus trituberculatus]